MAAPDTARAAGAIRSFIARSEAAQRSATARREQHLRALIAPLAAQLYASGVDRVWVFGSLIWGGLHPASDLDLAVSGLPAGTHIDAYAELWRLAGEPVDLVVLETCAPELRDRILASGLPVARP